MSGRTTLRRKYLKIPMNNSLSCIFPDGNVCFCLYLSSVICCSWLLGGYYYGPGKFYLYVFSIPFSYGFKIPKINLSILHPQVFYVIILIFDRYQVTFLWRSSKFCSWNLGRYSTRGIIWFLRSILFCLQFSISKFVQHAMETNIKSLFFFFFRV